MDMWSIQKGVFCNLLEHRLRLWVNFFSQSSFFFFSPPKSRLLRLIEKNTLCYWWLYQMVLISWHIYLEYYRSGQWFYLCNSWFFLKNAVDFGIWRCYNIADHSLLSLSVSCVVQFAQWCAKTGRRWQNKFLSGEHRKCQ